VGIDRFVRWDKKRPKLAVVQRVLEDYLGTAAAVWRSDSSRIIAKLVGKPSFPFRREPHMERYAAACEQHDERWLEVYVAKDHIDVITRQTDEYTGVVADGFATLAARYWEGKRDPE